MNDLYVRFENPRNLGIAKGVPIEIPEGLSEDDAIGYIADTVYNEIIHVSGKQILNSIKYEVVPSE